MVGHDGAEPEVRLPGRAREDRPDVQAGNAQGGRPVVAPEAAGATHQPRPSRARRLQLVEGDAEPRIHRRQLDAIRAGHEGCRHLVVEVDGARPAGRDRLSLQAGLREHQHLRIGVDVEPVEEAAQVAGPVAGPAQRGASVREAEPQLVHCIVGRPASKPQRRMVGGEGLFVRLLRRSGHRRHRREAERQQAGAGCAG